MAWSSPGAFTHRLSLVDLVEGEDVGPGWRRASPRTNLSMPGSEATAYGKMTIGQPISTVRHSSSISLLAKAMQPSVQSCCNVRFKPFG